MLTTFSHSDPRYARLFELIRQKNQAETTIARLKGANIRRITKDEMTELQRSANRSLDARLESRA